MRVIFISRGIKYLAPIIGFFEVIIWLLAIGQVMQNLTNVASYIAYGAGFAAGTLLGMMIEERLSLGLVIIRVITRRDSTGLLQHLKEHNYGFTSIDAEGSRGRVKILFMVLKRQNLREVIGVIKTYQPTAFYSIEDVKSVAEGVFPQKKSGNFLNYLDLMKYFRKDK